LCCEQLFTERGLGVSRGDVMNHAAALKYCPVTPVDGERSFSTHKLILTDGSHRLATQKCQGINKYCDIAYWKVNHSREEEW
jgi:hypothetical protein